MNLSTQYLFYRVSIFSTSVELEVGYVRSEVL